MGWKARDKVFHEFVIAGALDENGVIGKTFAQPAGLLAGAVKCALLLFGLFLHTDQNPLVPPSKIARDRQSRIIQGGRITG
jgi:hypothetical protein